MATAGERQFERDWRVAGGQPIAGLDDITYAVVA